MRLRGIFITFEGIDGSGKTTQIKRAVEWMDRHGLRHHTTGEPGGSDTGRAIREVIKGMSNGEPIRDPRAQSLLFFASRRSNLSEVIEPALADGRNVLCDRFTDSGVVYEAPNLPLGWFDRLDDLVTGGRRPDHTILLDLPAGEARARVTAKPGGDQWDYADVDVFSDRRVRYLSLAESESSRFHVVSAGGTVEGTAVKVAEVLRDIFPADQG